jgi:aspartyl-tRNA(Asn)/glutamyl-tRNA(Gln) amidotransferase subunit A
MPAGKQLVGPPFAEARLLNLGHLYQRETGWHERVPALPA